MVCAQSRRLANAGSQARRTWRESGLDAAGTGCGVALHQGILRLPRGWDFSPAVRPGAQLCLGVGFPPSPPPPTKSRQMGEVVPRGAEEGLFSVHLSQTWRESALSPGQPSQDVVPVMAPSWPSAPSTAFRLGGIPGGGVSAGVGQDRVPG